MVVLLEVYNNYLPDSINYINLYKFYINFQNVDYSSKCLSLLGEVGIEVALI